MKIKIDKKVLLVVGIVIFAIVLGSLARTYAQQVREQSDLRASLQSQQNLLRTLSKEKENWEEKREQAESLLNSSQAKFPQSVESIEYGEDLFEIAQDCNLDLTGLFPSKPVDKKVGSVTYSISTFVIKVEGNVDDILDFIYALRTGDDFRLPWSADLKAVNIDIGGGEQPEATITVDIYGYKR